MEEDFSRFGCVCTTMIQFSLSRIYEGIRSSKMKRMITLLIDDLIQVYKGFFQLHYEIDNIFRFWIPVLLYSSQLYEKYPLM